ncbi:MAG: hypothetical protein ACSLFR_17795 [Solirubrobacteraceae bacterium]
MPERAEGTGPRHAEGPTATPAEPLHRQERGRRGGRRVRTVPPEGSDPQPTPEPPRHASTENDERLFGDKPPHY